MTADPGLWSGRLALGWLIGGEWRFHPARFLTTAVAIAVGVALGFAVHLVNGSALASFDGAMRGLNGAAALSVRATSPLGFDERLYPRVARAEGVSDASPVVRLDARIGRTRLTLLGIDVIRAAQVTPSLIGIRPGLGTGNDSAFDGDALFLSHAAMAQARTAVGARVLVVANGRSVPLRVAGTLPGSGDTAAIGVMDIAAAQWRFDRLRRIDRLDLALSDRSAADAAVRAVLPPDAIVSSAEAQDAQGDALSRAYRVNLDMLALVALLTGGFLVYSAQSLVGRPAQPRVRAPPYTGHARSRHRRCGRGRRAWRSASSALPRGWRQAMRSPGRRCVGSAAIWARGISVAAVRISSSSRGRRSASSRSGCWRRAWAVHSPRGSRRVRHRPQHSRTRATCSIPAGRWRGGRRRRCCWPGCSRRSCRRSWACRCSASQAWHSCWPAALPVSPGSRARC